MLSLTARASRGIRTHQTCSPYCVHVAQGSFGRGRAAVLVRGYARKSRRVPKPDEPSTEELKPKDEGKSTESQAIDSQTTEDTKLSRKEKQKISQEKKSATKKKEDKSPIPPKDKSPTPPKNKKAKKSETAQPTEGTDDVTQLWKESLAMLTVLRGDLTKSDDPQKGDKDEKRSLKSVFPPIRNADSKLNRRQAALLDGTLDVLKNVLEIQARKRANTEKEASGSGGQKKNDGSEAMKKIPEKGARLSMREMQRQERSAAAVQVSQGFASLVANTRASRRNREIQPSLAVQTSRRTRRPLESTKISDSKEPIAWSKNRFLTVEKIQAGGDLIPIEAEIPPVPQVQYGLDRVLFNEGVTVLQDPRTKVYNFDPYLASIMPVTQFDFDALTEYITSSKDKTLIGITRKHGKKYTGSTSSMTSTLAHFHFLLSSWRPINPARLSREFEAEHESVAAYLRAPAATFLNYNDGIYAIDADKEWDDDTILSMLGKSMEKLLTVPKEEFERFRRSNSHELTEEERNQAESYHYTVFGDFMMRSQLDAHDPRLPGTGVFDLKTRAVVSIRMDAKNHEKGMGYEIRKRTGQWESFEREYYDMIRAAFLKYSLQVRMGRMDGIFVAYHNTQRIFGFQYIPVEEMDFSIHGSMDKTIGDKEFMTSLTLWNKMLNKATEKFPGQSLRVHVDTRPSKQAPFMYFFAEPVTPEEIKNIQERDQEEVDRFREEVLGIKPKVEGPDDVELPAEDSQPVQDEMITEEQEIQEARNTDDSLLDDVGEATAKEQELEKANDSMEDVQDVEDEDSAAVWEEMMTVVEETMDDDAQGITAIRDAIEEALRQSGLLQMKSSKETQHYIDALLTSIVDAQPQHVKDESKVEGTTNSEGVESEKTSSQEDNAAGGSAASEQNTDPEPVTTEPPAPKKSAFGFLSKLFGSTPKTETPATESPPSETPEGVQDGLSKDLQKVRDFQVEEGANTQHESVNATTAVPEGAQDTERGTEELTESTGPSSELVDLLIKLTSRIGVTPDVDETTQELSEDQAKLRAFESILSEMMPKADESPESQSDDMSSSFKDDKSEAADGAEAQSESEPAPKPVFGMILTVRNKVNGAYVERPDNLKSSDEWQVEYHMEEIPEAKVQALYAKVKSRRKAAFWQDPSRDRFADAFGGCLKRFTSEGLRFREEEDKHSKHQPLFVLGLPTPVYPGSQTKMPRFPAPNSEVIEMAKAKWERYKAQQEREEAAQKAKEERKKARKEVAKKSPSKTAKDDANLNAKEEQRKAENGIAEIAAKRQEKLQGA